MSTAIDIVAMLMQLLIYFVIIGGIFLLIRTIVLWYFRINQIAESLKTIAEAQPYILESLHSIDARLRQTSATSPFRSDPARTRPLP